MSRARTPEAAGTRPRRALRRALAVLTTTALATAVLPMAVASAAPTAGAALTAGQSVFPGTGSFTINVTNNRSLGLVGGETINYVDIQLPNTIGIKTAEGVTAPAGWTARRTDAGGIQTYTFRGGSLPVGSSLAFTFPGAVAAPTADRSGAFQVAVSGNDGQSTSNATGALSTTIRTLEVVAGSVKAVAPAGAADQSGTAGQTIQYALGVKNYARAAQTVTPSLTSNNSGDQITQASPGDVAAGAVRTFTSTVTLAPTGDRVATFTGAATAGSSNAPGVPATFEVQAPAALQLNAASFAPNTTRGLQAESYSVSVTKTNKPALTLNSAELTLPTNVTTPLTQATRTIGGNGPESLDFQPALVTAPDGRHGVSFDFAGVDSNGFAYSQNLSLANALLIDRLAPVIRNFSVKLPTDADGRQQTAASNNGNKIDVAGEIDDCNATLDFVRLVTNTGQEIPVNVTKSACSFTGSITSGGNGTTFAAGTTSFTGQAAARDAAGNVGSGATPTVAVDLVKPVLDSATTMGTGSKAERIRVSFLETGGSVFGGCNRSQWKVDGELLVRDVLFSDGTPCAAGKAGPDNDRILVLASPRDQELQTNVTYTPGARPLADPAIDRAGQDAVSKTVATIVGVVPAAPAITAVTRSAAAGGREEATLDEGAYYTNRPGSDTQVTFSGARDGYRVRVFDQNDTLLSQSPVSGSTATVAVPLGTTDGSYVRKLALVNTAGLQSDLTSFTVVLDRVAPRLAGVTKASANSVNVAFSEKLAGGANFAENWFVYENNPDADPSDPSTSRAYYQVGSVTGAAATRTLTLNRNLEDLGSLGADYIKRSPTGERYKDRAGNLVADTAA